MNNKLQKNSSAGLPAKMGDLAKYILFTREKLNAVRAGIRAIDKLGFAKDVREQKKQEAQYMATALLDAETKLGELFGKLPRDKSFRGNQHSGKQVLTSEDLSKTKKEVITDL